MEEEHVFLTRTDDAECEMFCEMLKKNNINYDVKDETRNAYFRLYGAQPVAGSKVIYVPAENYEEAKKILGLNNELKIHGSRYPLWVRIVAFIILFPIILFFLIRLFHLL